MALQRGPWRAPCAKLLFTALFLQSSAERPSGEEVDLDSAATEEARADDAGEFDTGPREEPAPSALMDETELDDSAGVHGRRHREAPNNFNGAQKAVQNELTQKVKKIEDKAKQAARLVRDFSGKLGQYHAETAEMALLMQGVQPFTKYIQNFIGSLADGETGRVDTLKNIAVAQVSTGQAQASDDHTRSILERVEANT